MAYTGRHSYFLCFLLFVFRRSPARLAVKNTLTRSVRKIFHEQPARRAALRDRPENNYFAARNEDDGFLLSIACPVRI